MPQRYYVGLEQWRPLHLQDLGCVICMCVCACACLCMLSSMHTYECIHVHIYNFFVIVINIYLSITFLLSVQSNIAVQITLFRAQHNF